MVCHPRARFCKKINISLGGPDAVANDKIRAEETHIVHILNEGLAKKLKAINLLEKGLSGMDMDHGPELFGSPFHGHEKLLSAPLGRHGPETNTAHGRMVTGVEIRDCFNKVVSCQ
jgi:hypothetical protein